MSSAGDLFADIKTLWDASDSLSSINGPYKDRKPPNLDEGFPYVIFESLANRLEFYTCANEYWMSAWSLSVYHRREQDCKDAIDLIGAVLDNPIFSSVTTQSNRRSEETWEEVDKDVRMASIEYITKWSKTRS